MSFTKKSADLTPIVDTVFAIVSLAKKDIAENGADVVTDATIGSLYNEEGQLVAFDTVFDHYDAIDHRVKAAYASSFTGNPDYRENPRELNKIIQTINLVKEDKNTTITGISIHGFASPESPYEHNAYLAENRARTLKDYVRKLLHLEDRIFSVEFTPEDWDGLRKYVAESALEHKTEILALIDDTKLNRPIRKTTASC